MLLSISIKAFLIVFFFIFYFFFGVYMKSLLALMSPAIKHFWIHTIETRSMLLITKEFSSNHPPMVAFKTLLFNDKVALLVANSSNSPAKNNFCAFMRF